MSCQGIARRSAGNYFALLLILIAFKSVAWPQMTTGNISGTAKDQSGAVLAGVAISATNVDTGVVRTTVSGGSGEYRVPALSAGNYEIKAELTGFESVVRKGITLSVGQDAVVDFSLKVGNVTEQVTVTGEAPVIQTTTATVSGLVDPKQMRDIPLNARSFIELVPLQAGAVFAETGEVSGVKGFGRKLSIVGTRYTSNSFLLDGADINDATGGSGSAASTVAGVETVREFRVVTNAYDAEYGRHTGGVISAITKSGTNELHGSLFEFLRNAKIDAPRWEDNAFGGGIKPAYKRNQFGFAVGGPIRKDKTFFFGSYEGLRERLGQTAVYTVPGLSMRNGIVRGVNIGVNPVIRPFLEAYPLPNSPDFADGRAFYSVAATQPTTQNYWMAKVDHRFSDSDSLFARYTRDNAERSTPGFNTSAVSATPARYVTTEETHIFSPRWLARTHFSFIRTNVSLRDVGLESFKFPIFSFDGGEVPGRITVSGLTAWGGSTLNPKVNIQNAFQFKEDFFFTQGRHSLKFGGQFERFRFNQLSDFHSGGTFAFASLEDFLNNKPSTANFIRPGSDDIRGMRQNLTGLYVHDDISLRPGLTLNAGVRYEFISVPTEVNGKLATIRDMGPAHIYTLTETQTDIGNPYFLNPSLKNFAPRVGLAWVPFGHKKTSVRAGGGFFHEQILPDQYFVATTRVAPFFSVAGLLQQNLAIDFPNAYYSQRQALIQNIGSKPQVDLVQWNVEQPTIYKWSFDVEQQGPANTSIQTGYSGTRGVHLFRGNLLLNTTPSEIRNGRRYILIDQPLPNPNWDRIRTRTTDATSTYHAFRFGVNKQFSKGFQMQSNYTFSKSTDDSSTFSGSSDFSADRTAYRLEKDHALSAFDVRHSWTSNFVYELPGRQLTGAAGALLGGWTTSGILRFNSGSAFNISAELPRLVQGGRTFQEIYVSGSTLDLIPGGNTNPISPQNPNQYFDVSQFSFPVPFYQGNLGRNTLIGPGTANVDFTLMKDTHLPRLGENTMLEFRTELYNLFNRPAFGIPASSLFNQNGQKLNTAGRITTTRNSSRQVQFGLKLIF